MRVRLTVGGIISTFSFLAKDAPKYISGYSVCVAFLGISMAASCVYFVGVTLENRRRESGLGSATSITSEDKGKLGDLDPYYRYLR